VVYSLSRRILEKLSYYYPIQDSTQYEFLLAEIPVLQEGEMPLGVYANQPGQCTENIVITNLGLHLLVDKIPAYVDYSQIKNIETPNTKDADHLVIHLVDGRIVKLHIRGKHDRFRDVFEFLRFLDRVIKAL